MKECPNCKLANPPEAQVCDCGYNFESGSDNIINQSKIGQVECFYTFISSLVLNIFFGIGGLGVYILAQMVAYDFPNTFLTPAKYKSGNVFAFTAISLIYLVFVICINYLLFKITEDKYKPIYFFQSTAVFVLSLMIALYIFGMCY